MTSVYEIQNWAGVLSFSAWTLVVCAIAKFLFGSYPAAELLYRLARLDRQRQKRIAERKSASQSAPGEDPSQQGTPGLLLAPAWQRVLSYFLTCFACQSFWAAVVVYALTRSPTDWRAWLFSAAAYSAAATMLAKASQGRVAVTQRSGCGSCGER